MIPECKGMGSESPSGFSHSTHHILIIITNPLPQWAKWYSYNTSSFSTTLHYDTSACRDNNQHIETDPRQVRQNWKYLLHKLELEHQQTDAKHMDLGTWGTVVVAARVCIYISVWVCVSEGRCVCLCMCVCTKFVWHMSDTGTDKNYLRALSDPQHFLQSACINLADRDLCLQPTTGLSSHNATHRHQLHHIYHTLWVAPHLVMWLMCPGRHRTRATEKRVWML